MTADEFLALPDDGIERMLIDGIVREPHMQTIDTTGRNRHHSQLTLGIGHFLELGDEPNPSRTAWRSAAKRACA